MTPLGLVAAFCLDAGVITGRLRPLADAVVLLATGCAALVMIVLCREAGLRLYHLLGILIGAVLYTEGIGKIIRLIVHRKELKRRTAK